MAQPGSDMQLARRGVALHVPFAARACWRWRWLGGSQKHRRAHGKFSPPGALRIPGSWVQSPGSRDACVVRGITTVGPWRYGILLGAKILKSQTSLHLPAVKFPFSEQFFFEICSDSCVEIHLLVSMAQTAMFESQWLSQ